MNQTITQNHVDSTRDVRAGKYLTFVLDGEDYGVAILKVREIIGLLKITPVPNMPAYARGVINLRGRVIPVLDLRLRFGMTEGEVTSESCIIVVDVRGTQTGIFVDRVSEVLDIAGADIEDAPILGGEASQSIIGMAKAKGRVKILLEIDRVFAASEIETAELPA